MAESTQFPPIKFYDITIDASGVENDAMKLFHELRPKWAAGNIKTKVSLAHPMVAIWFR